MGRSAFDHRCIEQSRAGAGGSPKIEETQNVPDFSYARFAEMLDLGAVRISSPGEVGPAWEAALSADRPFVIDAMWIQACWQCRRM